MPSTAASTGHFSLRLQQSSGNLPHTYPTSRRLFVVSGSKDQFRPFCHLLIKHKVVNQNLRWTFGEGHLVLFGNSHDHCTPDPNWWWFLYGLEQKARAKGGAVHFLPGPYELAQRNGPWQYEHPAYPPAAAKSRSPFTALYSANFELKQWLSSRNTVEKIGHLLFVHYDLLPLLVEKATSLTAFNALVRLLCAQQPASFATLPTLALPTEKDLVVETVNKLLQQFNVMTLVTGNDLKSTTNSTFDGKLIHIGADYDNGNPSGVYIKRHHFLQADRKGTRIPI
ncbi:MAG: hypothetical protein J7621_21925 [Niastella sp.]|nr:hypothetical protein [Niastella sp.]